VELGRSINGTAKEVRVIVLHSKRLTVPMLKAGRRRLLAQPKPAVQAQCPIRLLLELPSRPAFASEAGVSNARESEDPPD